MNISAGEIALDPLSVSLPTSVWALLTSSLCPSPPPPSLGSVDFSLSPFLSVGPLSLTAVTVMDADGGSRS